MTPQTNKIYQKHKEDINLWIGILILSIICFILLIILSTINILGILRIILGSIFVLFLPGYIITFLFFETKEIDILEKIALSFTLSISIIPLITFYLNFLFSMPINTLNIFLTITGIILLSIYIKSKEKTLIKISSAFDKHINEKIIKRNKLLSKIFKE